MPDNKKQHFLPRFYMKGFSPDEKNIWTYRIDDKKLIGYVPYKNQCQSSYFYGEDLSLEKRLSEMENNWNSVFKIIFEAKELHDRDFKYIKQFAIYQYQRTAAELEFEQDSLSETIFETAKSKLNHSHVQYDIKKLKEECDELAQKKISPTQTLKYCDSLLEIIDDLKVLVINYKTDHQLLFSDSPIIMMNPFFMPGVGYGVIGLVIVFPVSPNQLVVLYDSKIYSRYRENSYITSYDENEVVKLNELQLVSAHKLLYSSNSKPFDDFSETDWTNRSVFRGKRAIDTLGSSDNKLILSSLRRSYVNYDWSFAQIQHRYRRIPFLCKDAYPRLYDEGWNKKLEMRFPAISIAASANKRFWEERKVTKKDFKRGCERMTGAIRAYWNY